MRELRLETTRALGIAAATAHDAVLSLERESCTDGRLTLARAAAALLEITLDAQAACDFDHPATGKLLLEHILGALPSARQ